LTIDCFTDKIVQSLRSANTNFAAATKELDMERTLGARKLGELIKETFTVYGRNFARIIAIQATVEVPLMIIGVIFVFMVSMPTISHVETFAGIFQVIERVLPAYAVLAIVSYVLGVFLQGAMIHAVAEQYVRSPISVGRAFSFSWKRILNMLGATILVGITILAILVVIIGIPTVTYLSNTDFGMEYSDFSKYFELVAIIIVLSMIALIPVLYFSIFWQFAVQSVLLERCNPIQALSHSWELVRGSWWRVLGIVLVFVLMIMAINVIVSIVPIVGGIAGAIFVPQIISIGLTLLYFDLRVRKEGYNLNALANELGLPDTTTGALANPPQ
jgi:hypothetical protein